jgi:hypothetical protein
MSAYLSFIAGLAVGFVGHGIWCCLQGDPGADAPAHHEAPTELWPQAARLAVRRVDPDEHEEFYQ